MIKIPGFADAAALGFQKGDPETASSAAYHRTRQLSLQLFYKCQCVSDDMDTR